FGGCYVDADETSLLPLRILTANGPGRTLVLVRDRWMGLFNLPLMAAPRHPLIGRALRRATDTLLGAGEGAGKLPIWQTAGTGLLRQVFVEWVLEDHDAAVETTMLISEWDSV